MLVVVYARASPGEHSRRSVPEQLRLARKKAQDLAGDSPLTVREFQDPETSGDIPPPDRPGFAAALQTAREERAAFFVCLDPDRFSRDVYQALGAADEVDRTGARLAFALHEYDMSPEGRLFFTLRVAIAEYEKHKIRERTQRGIRAKLARGGLPYAPRPYGYRFDRDTDSLAVVPDQARWVRAVFGWVAGERLGPQQVATRLNSLGVPAPGGNWWHRQAVARMVRNPVYKGELVVNKSDQSGMRRNRHLPPAQRVSRRPRPPSEWLTLPAPAIVAADLWDRAQAALGARRRPPAPRNPYLLTGASVCGRCGRPCHGFSNGSRRRYYVCAGRYGTRQGAGAPAPCDLPHLPAGPLEEQVRAAVGRWLLNAGAFRAAWRQAQAEAGGVDPAAELARVRQALGALEAEWDRRAEAFHKGWVRDRERAAAELAEVKRRAETLREQEGALARQAEAGGAAPGAPDGAAPGDGIMLASGGAEPGKPDGPAPGAPGDDLSAAMAARVSRLDPEEWQMAVRLLVRRVVLRPGVPPVPEPR